MMAFEEHGEVRPSLFENVEGARQVLRELAAAGIDMDKVTSDLRVDGVKLFADSIDKLLEEIANKKQKLQQGSVGAHEAQLGALDGAVSTRLEQLEQAGRSDTRGARRWRNRIADHCVAMNEIQMLGTHNSYHVQPRPALLDYYLMTAASVFGAWEYTHIPLDQQFSTEGIRQIELDVFADPEGGRFARPKAWATLKALGKDAGPDPDPTGALKKPGFKVLHVPDVDYLTTAPTSADPFKGCSP